MSRIGKQTIEIPQGVTVDFKDGTLTVKGPKGTLTRSIDSRVQVNIADGVATVDVQKKEDKEERSLWGTYASHIKNMVVGVSVGFKKELEINGVGYRVSASGNTLKLEVGYSHPVEYVVAKDVSVAVDKNHITLESADKELLGQVAAEIRKVRPPEPYKGKGIKYVDEVIRRKAGKAAKAAGA